MKSLEPYRKLGTDTWFYTKRCFLSLIENVAKHMIVLRDSVIQECISFLENCERKQSKIVTSVSKCFLVHGKTIRTTAYSTLSDDNDAPNGKETVTYEARKIKAPPHSH